jgi:hypothetical protein
MRTLTLDYQATHPKSRLGMVLLLGGMALLIMVLASYREARQEVVLLQAKLAKTQGLAEKRERRQDSERAGGTNRGEEIAVANTVINRLSLPWNDMFSAFEMATNRDIALLDIVPDVDKRSVVVTAETKHTDLMIDYLKRLEQSGMLNDVLLQKHEVQLKDPEQPLRFVISASWKERK